MKINANMSALIPNKQLLRIENNLAKSMERLSSGFKLNHAKDDPAGMAISNKMQAQINALDRASNNASDAISAIRIADGALNEASSIMQRMRELCVQAANDTNSLEDRQAIQEEIDALKKEVTRISEDTEYNGMPILDGSLSARVYANNVERVEVSDQVNAGNYEMEIITAATQAVVEAASPAANDTKIEPSNTTDKIEVSGTVSVNGYSVQIEKSDSISEVYAKLREAADVGGTTLSSTADGALKFTSQDYGKSVATRVEFSSEELADKLGFKSVVLDPKTKGYVVGTLNADEVEVPTGEDAKIKLNTDSAFSETATVKQDNNRVIITDKKGFSMSCLVEENYVGKVNFEVTDIGTMTIHIGANKDQNMMISVPEISTNSLYLDDIDVTKMGGADKALRKLDEAIAAVSSARSKLGSYENRLDYSTASLDTFEENMTNALSRLKDTDMAAEMTTYTQQNVLNQAAISVLAQANEMPQQVLQLLQ